MSNLFGNQSNVRLHRANAARVLLQLNQADQLDSPQTWNWDVLDSLPNWCLQSAPDRMILQLCCGALLLSPELRLWIDRDRIVACHSIIGEGMFNSIVDQAQYIPTLSSFGVSTEINSLRTTFEQAGALVLKGALPPALPSERLSICLGETTGYIDFELAQQLLLKATGLLEVRT